MEAGERGRIVPLDVKRNIWPAANSLGVDKTVLKLGQKIIRSGGNRSHWPEQIKSQA